MKALLVSCVVVLSATPVHADILTPGTWSPATPGAYYDGLSWDCAECGIGFLLADSPQLEYLNLAGQPTSFQVTGALASLTPLYSLTDWTSGVLSHDLASGVFRYDSGTGRLSDSVESFWQYAWFRSTDSSGQVIYFGGVEDILFGDVLGREDRDYNDLVFRFTLPPEEPPGEPIPEPASLLLFGLGLLGVRRRLCVRFGRSGRANVTTCRL